MVALRLNCKKTEIMIISGGRDIPQCDIYTSMLIKKVLIGWINAVILEWSWLHIPLLFEGNNLACLILT